LKREDVRELRVVPERVQRPLVDGAGIPEDVLGLICQKLLDQRRASGSTCHDLVSPASFACMYRAITSPSE
jgi:hypothetical protein